jgi:hypothetical protein
MLKVLKHPGAQMQFVDLNTPVEWPLDQFTTRRLAQGDIKRVGGDIPSKFEKPVTPRYGKR